MGQWEARALSAFLHWPALRCEVDLHMREVDACTGRLPARVSREGERKEASRVE